MENTGDKMKPESSLRSDTHTGRDGGKLGKKAKTSRCYSLVHSR